MQDKENIIYSKINAYLRNQNRDESFIQNFNEGYCSGLSSLWLYVKWLQTQSQSDDKERDDYGWFIKVVNILTKWDEKADLSAANKNEVNRFVAHIEFFQNIDNYLSIGQGELQKSLEDTKKRELKKEYSIAALFTLEQLKKLLKIETIIQDKKLILINSHNHDVALFKYEGNYSFFDPNKGERVTTNTDAIAPHIFSANEFRADTPSPLGLRIFGFDKSPGYKSVPEVLKEVGIINDRLSDANYCDNVTGLSLASRVGSTSSVKYLLELPNQINQIDIDGLTALMYAAMTGHAEVVKRLIDARANVNMRDNDGITALMHAALNGYDEIVQKLIIAHATLDLQDSEGITALMWAAENGHTKIVEMLIKAGANVRLEDKDGNTALKLAEKKGHSGVVKMLKNYSAAKIIQRAWRSYIDRKRMEKEPHKSHKQS